MSGISPPVTPCLVGAAVVKLDFLALRVMAAVSAAAPFRFPTILVVMVIFLFTEFSHKLMSKSSRWSRGRKIPYAEGQRTRYSPFKRGNDNDTERSRKATHPKKQKINKIKEDIDSC